MYYKAGNLNYFYKQMSSSVKILPHYTYEDYCKWEGRWELINGIPHTMSPAPYHGISGFPPI
jgi:hypothetical protein